MLLVLLMLLSLTPAEAACERPASLQSLRGLLQHARTTAYYQLEPQSAALELEAAEGRLECMSELATAADLTSFYLWYASVYIDLGQESRAQAAVERAAAVSGPAQYADPALSQKVRLMYLEARERMAGRPPGRLHLQGIGGQRVCIDGQPAAGSLELVMVGEHFVQVGRAGGWDGYWVNMLEGEWALKLGEGGGAGNPTDRAVSTESGSGAGGSGAGGSGAGGSGGGGSGAGGSGAGGSGVGGSGGESGGTASRGRLELVPATPGKHARLAKRWTIGLGAAAVVSAGVFLYEEGLYQSGALIDNNGVPGADYAAHYRAHWASGVATGLLSAATVSAALLSLHFGRESRASGVSGRPAASAGIRLTVAPHGPVSVLLSGAW